MMQYVIEQKDCMKVLIRVTCLNYVIVVMTSLMQNFTYCLILLEVLELTNVFLSFIWVQKRNIN
jgi:hypothetical protein